MSDFAMNSADVMRLMRETATLEAICSVVDSHAVSEYEKLNVIRAICGLEKPANKEAE